MTVLLALVASGALAKEPIQPIERPFGFTEVAGGYGFQLGTTPYVPVDGEFKHPLTNGPSVGGAIGLGISQNLYVLGDYTYAEGHSREGNIPNAVDVVDGEIKFHTLSLGLRTVCGKVNRVYGELAAGVLFPFHTQVTYEYNAALSPLGITGTGTMRDDYQTGYGGHGAMGYQRMIADRLYVSGLVKLRLYTTSNNDEKTTLNNFVTDFTAVPPAPVDATITYGTNLTDTPASTYSVQDARVQIAVGAYF